MFQNIVIKQFERNEVKKLTILGFKSYNKKIYKIYKTNWYANNKMKIRANHTLHVSYNFFFESFNF